MLYQNNGRVHKLNIIYSFSLTMINDMYISTGFDPISESSKGLLDLLEEEKREAAERDKQQLLMHENTTEHKQEHNNTTTTTFQQHNNNTTVVLLCPYINHHRHPHSTTQQLQHTPQQLSSGGFPGKIFVSFRNYFGKLCLD